MTHAHGGPPGEESLEPTEELAEAELDSVAGGAALFRRDMEEKRKLSAREEGVKKQASVASAESEAKSSKDPGGVGRG